MARQKTLLIIAVLVIVMGILYVWFRPDGKLHVVFCDVGQGDAILIIKGDKQLLVDGGPDDKVLGCIARHVPFYDRSIEMLVSTHPQADHMNGLIYALQRYRVKYFFANQEGNQTSGYTALVKELAKNKMKVTALYAGSVIRFGGLQYKTVWPVKEWLGEHLICTDVCLTDGTNMNGFGISGVVTYGDFDVLLTADVDQPFQALQLATGMIRPVDVLKVPHHGSRTGMSGGWLDVVRPKVAVISNGKKNKYGHPAPEALKLLKDRNIQIYRTDSVGDVEIVSDGKEWWVVQ